MGLAALDYTERESFVVSFFQSLTQNSPGTDLLLTGYLPDSGGNYMLWFRTTDNRFVRAWCHRDRLLDKAFGTTSGRTPLNLNVNSSG